MSVLIVTKEHVIECNGAVFSSVWRLWQHGQFLVVGLVHYWFWSFHGICGQYEKCRTSQAHQPFPLQFPNHSIKLKQMSDLPALRRPARWETFLGMTGWHKSVWTWEEHRRESSDKLQDRNVTVLVSTLRRPYMSHVWMTNTFCCLLMKTRNNRTKTKNCINISHFSSKLCVVSCNEHK